MGRRGSLGLVCLQMLVLVLVGDSSLEVTHPDAPDEEGGLPSSPSSGQATAAHTIDQANPSLRPLPRGASVACVYYQLSLDVDAVSVAA